MAEAGVAIGAYGVGNVFATQLGGQHGELMPYLIE